MLYLNVKLISSIKDCMASCPALIPVLGTHQLLLHLGSTQCLGSDVFQEKSQVKPSTQPKPASKRLREQWSDVSLHQGAAVRHRRVQNLFSLWATPGPWRGMCTLEEEFTGGEKGILLDYS